MVTVTVFADDGGSHSDTFALEVKSAEVVGRHIFYNNSYWDGNDPAANTDDDNAIAPDPDHATDPSLGKTALLPALRLDVALTGMRCGGKRQEAANRPCDLEHAGYIGELLFLAAFPSQHLADDQHADPDYANQVILDGNWADAP
jgi:hypothetical protein